MTTPTQLTLYNQALRMIGEPPIASLAVNRPERHMMDTIWAEDPVKGCLEEANWTFATRALEWNYDSSVNPDDWGYRYGFTKPGNYVRLVAICSDEYFDAPLLRFEDENNYWFCDLETIYIKYIDDSTSYGRDYSLWPEAFRECVACKMAAKAAIGLTKSQAIKDAIDKEFDKYLKKADMLDSFGKPTRFLPAGRWTSARRGSSSGRYDRA